MDAFLLVLKPFWPLIWRGALVVTLALAGWWAWDHYVKDPYIAEGVAREHVQTVKETQRADTAVANYADLQRESKAIEEKLATVKTDLQTLEAQGVAAQQEAAKKIAKLATKEKTLKDEIAKNQAIAAGPPAPTQTEACDDADQILNDLLTARRLRDGS